ncbi:MAG: hypothetical protein L0191_09055, partial [Acidobacteria bacterium]|nr:hypothetical protein [Acidobacteriota bacterium]
SMFATLRILSFTIVALVLGLIAHAPSSPSAESGGVPGPKVLRSDQLSKQQFEQQFRALPDSALVESRGQRMTKAQIRALAAQKGQQHQASAQAALNQARAAFEQRRVQFDQQQQAKLQASNAKARAEMARLRQAGGPVARSTQREVIQQEAAQLFQRSKTASPAEQVQIEQRAAQLLQQLQQVGR